MTVQQLHSPNSLMYVFLKITMLLHLQSSRFKNPYNYTLFGHGDLIPYVYVITTMFKGRLSEWAGQRHTYSERTMNVTCAVWPMTMCDCLIDNRCAATTDRTVTAHCLAWRRSLARWAELCSAHWSAILTFKIFTVCPWLCMIFTLRCECSPC